LIRNTANKPGHSRTFWRTFWLRSFSNWKTVLQVLSVFGAMTLLSSQTLAGDADAGAARAATCAACHGQDGNSANPQWPSIAGQNESYLVATLQAFKDGTRSDMLMGAQAAALSEQDMADLATYFASQTPARRTADPDLADTGGRLYRGGNKEIGTSACIACHGPTGQGNAPAAYPAVAGQHAAYTAKQLNDYKNGTRTSDGESQIMRNITEHLSTDEIAAVAAYMQGLH
jgi:cytochrome c553